MPTIVFTLKDYLNTQKQLQVARGDKVTVPSMKDLATASGMEVTPFSRMINNQTDSVSRAKIALVIAELKRLGFEPFFGELFAYYD